VPPTPVSNREPGKPINLPVLYSVATAVAMALARNYFPIAPMLAPPVGYIVGTVLIVAGIGVTVSAGVSFRQARTPLLPFEQSTTVVTTGLYRLSRNPMYVGMAMTLLGIASLMGRLSPFLLVAVFVAIIHFRFVLPEEKFLEGLFGTEYLDYKKRVRRWI